MIYLYNINSKYSIINENNFNIYFSDIKKNHLKSYICRIKRKQIKNVYPYFLIYNKQNKYEFKQKIIFKIYKFCF